MCGITGFIDESIQDDGLIQKMLDSLAHRGPDASTFKKFTNTYLGHRRLSIIDLNTGDQPMFNEAKNLCIVFNGEIYNYKEIKKELEALGVAFNTFSDTEVILKAYEVYGVDSLNKLNGIFAFAIYDTLTKELFLARDYFGVKPLHYYNKDGVFIFASEQKAILEHPSVPRALNKKALHLQLNLRYTQGSETLFKGINRLPPGHLMKVANGKLEVKSYWKLEPKINHQLNEAEAIEGIHYHIRQAIKRQLVSDVPIGVYLSGGLDSSTIVQKMSELGVDDIKTFTLGFNEPTDEFPDAKRVADYFKTQHFEHSLTMNPLEEMEKVIWHAEEPKINLLQGFQMSKFVNPHVKVILGGLGGDELLAGYDLHKFIYPTQKFHSKIPNGLKTLLRWKSDFLYKVQNASKTLRYDEYRRGIQMLLSIGQIEKYYLIIRNVWDFDQGQWKNIYSKDYLNEIKNEVLEVVTWFQKYFEESKKMSPLDQVLFTEFQTKMVNDYLLVDDRMSMAHSIEERVPFLDRDLVEFGFSIPIELKMLNGQTKGLFRKAMRNKLPEKIITKKKWGFTVNPYLQFRKDLGEKIHKELTKEYLVKEGIFNPDYINLILNYPSHPKLRWHYNYLWVLLGFKIWKEVFKIDT
jgi:asparagine synthase (glutamine-hydrolysing)